MAVGAPVVLPTHWATGTSTSAAQFLSGSSLQAVLELSEHFEFGTPPPFHAVWFALSRAGSDGKDCDVDGLMARETGRICAIVYACRARVSGSGGALFSAHQGSRPRLACIT